MIHVGDKVRIEDAGRLYSTYSGFLDYYREVGCSEVIERVCSQYEYGNSATTSEVHDKVFTVMFIREHGTMEGNILAIVNDGDTTYIINVEGLSLVSSDMPVTEGDKVYISNPGPVYSMWDNLIKNVTTVIPDGVEVRRKWYDGHSPAAEEIGGKSPNGIFTVKWVGRHISRPEEGILAIISNNTHTYIIDVTGLARAGEKSWEKYIIYVRNWAVVNKDTAQSVRDATGPKPYAEWLNNKS